MRLHVSIKRHTLPPTNILFTTRSLNPDPATSSPDATISQLLQDIDDVVPLQSADWGLEDYAVEVNGYECLHFAPYESVLRDDDQVVVRALKTEDLRRRRQGGRHQITSDGRHLIDGVAFGRQWLKKGGRPEVLIPPRKKRRLELEAGDGDMDEDKYGPKEMFAMLTSSMGGGDSRVSRDGGSDEEDDSDFVDGDDMEGSGDDEDSDEEPEPEPEITVDIKGPLRITAGQDFDDADDESNSSNGEEDDSDNDLDDELVSDDEAELAEELQFLLDNGSPTANDTETRQDAVTQSCLDGRSKTYRSPRKRKRDPEHDEADDLEPEFEGFSTPLANWGRLANNQDVSSSDSDITSSSGSGSDEEETVTAPAVTTGSPTLKKSIDYDESTDSSEDTSSGDSDSPEDTSSDDSDSDVELDSDVEFDSDAESDESSGSSSSSSQTSEIASADADVVNPKSSPRKNPQTTPKDVATDSKAQTSTRPAPVPPGQGLKRTKYSNRRQKMRQRLSHLKEQGLLPANANFDDMAAYDEAASNDIVTADVRFDQLVAATAELDDEVENLFAAKKQELLQQVEEPEPSLTVALGTATPAAQRMPEDKDAPDTAESGKGRSVPEINFAQATPTKDHKGSFHAEGHDTKSEPPKQRAKLDLNASRNMIFSGLGVRKPKTAAAEKALREKLDKPVKGALPKQLFKDSAPKQDQPLLRLEDSQVPWETKLILSAVECEVDGVTLKEPPFPFVQGWDENANRRYGKNKKKGRMQQQYYQWGNDAAQDWYEEEQVEIPGHDVDMTEGENRADFPNEEQEEGFDVDEVTAHDEATEQATTGATAPLKNDATDLPRPENIEGLDHLQQHHLRAGALIAYKELHVSASFQPEISDYRIARVDAVQEDGSLELTLSVKDRRSKKEVKYNTETGARILEKFEMWIEDEDVTEDDGYRTLSYADLIEPKLVQLPNSSFASTSTIEGTGPATGNGLSNSTEESVSVLETAVSDHSEPPSAQPQAVPVPIVEIEPRVEVTTPRRTEISNIMKEAGFNSALDSELLQPLERGTENNAQSSPVGDSGIASQSKISRRSSAGPTSQLEPPAPDTSGLDSPCFNGWSSSAPFEPDDYREADDAGSMLNSSQNGKKAVEDKYVGDESITTRSDVRYPQISQLEINSSSHESPAAESHSEPYNNHRDGGEMYAASSVDVASPREEPEGSVAERVEETNLDSLKSVVHPSDDGRDEQGIDVVEGKDLESLKSVIPPSVNESQENHQPMQERNQLHSAFLDGPGGIGSSEDSELPSLRQITSSAQATSIRESPPPVVRRRQANKKRRRSVKAQPQAIVSFTDSESDRSSDAPFMKRSQSQVRSSQVPLRASPRRKASVKERQKLKEEEQTINRFSDSEELPEPPNIKQSQSQVRLSQIPKVTQVVDLTMSSDPVSPGNSDGEYGSKRSASTGSRSGRGEKSEMGKSKSTGLETNVGLGNRRLLKSKKAKP